MMMPVLLQFPADTLHSMSIAGCCRADAAARRCTRSHGRLCEDNVLQGSPERRLIGSRQRVVLLDELPAMLLLLCLQKAV